MTSASSGVAYLSSSGINFNYSGLCLIFKRWAESVSSESDMLAVFSIGFGVAGNSSSRIGFNHSGLCLIFGGWIELCPPSQIYWQYLALVCHQLVAKHVDRIVAWRSLKEHLECQTSSMLMTEELEAVMNQKRQCHVKALTTSYAWPMVGVVFGGIGVGDVVLLPVADGGEGSSGSGGGDSSGGGFGE
uniref:Uncharacterized protein n=1 Tax=Tanacetum cinerariifolium TaxID=118510 RepID=A0A6L2LXN0_TANCI|nr:hypothetical protein [Tanacetum cinerariifolium]